MNEPERPPTRPICVGDIANQVGSAFAGPIGRLRSRWIEYWRSPQPRKDAVFLCTMLAVVFVVNGTVAGHVYVPTGSMKDTIRENERFIVWKLGYGVQNLFSPRHKLQAVLQFLTPSPFRTRHEIDRWGDMGPFRHEIIHYVADVIRQ